jgi:hypothetical protein
MSSLLIGALVVGLVVVVVLQLRKQPGAKPAPRKPAPGSRATPAAAAEPRRVKPPSEGIDKFRGATLFPQKGACEAIMKLRGRTFPEGRIPPVPVPGCDRERCECQVHEVVGRRRGPRRVAVDRRGDVRFSEDRRDGKDRREGADTWKQSID